MSEICTDCMQMTAGRCARHNSSLFPSDPNTAPGPVITVNPTGWKCPGCGACHAPWVPTCMVCLPSSPRDTTGAGS